MHVSTLKKLALGGGATLALLGPFILGGVSMGYLSAAPPATPGTPTTVVQNEEPETNEPNEVAPDPATVEEHR